jgi:hypothetical protein
MFYVSAFIYPHARYTSCTSHPHVLLQQYHVNRLNLTNFHASVLLSQRKKKLFWSTQILTWDGIKTLGILTSYATTVWAAFLSTSAFRILVASVDACCVEYGQWWAVRTEARLHVVIRQTIIYALEHKMWWWLQDSLVSCRSHILDDKCNVLNHKIQVVDDSTPVGHVGLLAGYSITRNAPADLGDHVV